MKLTSRVAFKENEVGSFVLQKSPKSYKVVGIPTFNLCYFVLFSYFEDFL